MSEIKSYFRKKKIPDTKFHERKINMQFLNGLQKENTVQVEKLFSIIFSQTVISVPLALS